MVIWGSLAGAPRQMQWFSPLALPSLKLKRGSEHFAMYSLNIKTLFARQNKVCIGGHRSARVMYLKSSHSPY
jgi:hypothetical protein